MKCKNCQTELTLVENPKGNCLRCLSCKPLSTAPIVEEKKKDNYVDVPWTDERIWESVKPKIAVLFLEMLEDWHSPAKDLDRVEPRKPDNPPKSWRAQAKELGIEVYDKARKRPRLKKDVLADIDAKQGTSK